MELILSSCKLNSIPQIDPDRLKIEDLIFGGYENSNDFSKDQKNVERLFRLRLRTLNLSGCKLTLALY